MLFIFINMTHLDACRWQSLAAKNILVFDIETTGLPITPSFGKYYDYKQNDKYDSSRILSIAWCLVENYPNKINNIKTFIRKIDIKITNSHIHGITNEIVNNGQEFDFIFDQFYDDLIKSDYILAHNVDFDRSILLNELYRNNHKCLDILLNKEKLCTGKIFTPICNLKRYNGELKMPKLSELYYFLFNTLPINQHDAAYDVLTLIHIIMNKIFDVKID